MKENKLDPGLSGVAGEFLCAAEVTRKGYVASLTMRNTQGIDVLVSKADLIMRLDQDLNSPEMKSARKVVVSEEGNTSDGQRMRIWDFVEKIAHLNKMKMLDIDTIYKMWGDWIEHSWLLSEKEIIEYRNGGYYRQSEGLFYRLIKKRLIDEKSLICLFLENNRQNLFAKYRSNFDVENELKIFKKEEKESL